MASGVGLAQLPLWMVRHDIHSGQLVTVLDGISGGEMPINILWPRTPTLPAKVRVVVDELLRNAHRFDDSAPIERRANADEASRSQIPSMRAGITRCRNPSCRDDESLRTRRRSAGPAQEGIGSRYGPAMRPPAGHDQACVGAAGAFARGEEERGVRNSPATGLCGRHWRSEVLIAEFGEFAAFQYKIYFVGSRMSRFARNKRQSIAVARGAIW
jgi:hypothetical protein